MWPVGVSAVAANEEEVAYPFGMLALSPTECKAIHISGTGVVDSASNVQSNSNGVRAAAMVANIGFSRTGAASPERVAPTGCAGAAASSQDQGCGTMTCVAEEYSFALPDPLLGLPAPNKDPARCTDERVGRGHEQSTPRRTSRTTARVRLPRRTRWRQRRTCACSGRRIAGQSQVDPEPGLYPGGLDSRAASPHTCCRGSTGSAAAGSRRQRRDHHLRRRRDRHDQGRLHATAPLPPCTGRGRSTHLQLEARSTLAAGPITIGGGGAHALA